MAIIHFLHTSTDTPNRPTSSYSNLFQPSSLATPTNTYPHRLTYSSQMILSFSTLLCFDVCANWCHVCVWIGIFCWDCLLSRVLFCCCPHLAQVMQNLGYFQLQAATPGLYTLRLAPKAQALYVIDKEAEEAVGSEEVEAEEEEGALISRSVALVFVGTCSCSFPLR